MSSNAIASCDAVPIWLYSRKERGWHFLPMIMLAGQLGYGVAITSYNDNMHIGMTADSRMMPEVDRMKSFAQEAFHELRSAVETSTLTVTRVSAQCLAALLALGDDTLALSSEASLEVAYTAIFVSRLVQRTVEDGAPAAYLALTSC